MIQGNVCDNPICIDVSQIPEETKFYIASATYDFYMRVLCQPEVKKRIEERIENKKKISAEERRKTRCKQQAQPQQKESENTQLTS